MNFKIGDIVTPTIKADAVYSYTNSRASLTWIVIDTGKELIRIVMLQPDGTYNTNYTGDVVVAEYFKLYKQLPKNFIGTQYTGWNKEKRDV